MYRGRGDLQPVNESAKRAVLSQWAWFLQTVRHPGDPNAVKHLLQAASSACRVTPLEAGLLSIAKVVYQAINNQENEGKEFDTPNGWHITVLEDKWYRWSEDNTTVEVPFDHALMLFTKLLDMTSALLVALSLEKSAFTDGFYERRNDILLILLSLVLILDKIFCQNTENRDCCNIFSSIYGESKRKLTNASQSFSNDNHVTHATVNVSILKLNDGGFLPLSIIKSPEFIDFITSTSTQLSKKAV